MAPPVDRFIHIIEENNLSPEDIEKVEYTPHAIALNRMWRENDLKTEEDFGFHGPYLIACAAYRIKSIDFQSPNVRTDPRIREFMKKVKVLPNPHENFGPAMLDDPMARVLSIEVWVKGQTFKETTGCTQWSCSIDGFRATDEDLINKFKEIASGLLPSEKLEKAPVSLLKLEEFEDLNYLMEMVRP